MTLEPDRLTRATFPHARPRRLRRTEAMRAMVRETRLSVDSLVEDARAVADLGIQALLLLFGMPHAKDGLGSEVWATHGIESCSDRLDASVKHVRGRHDVGARLGLSDCRARDGTARLIARMACWTMSSTAHAWEPSQSFACGKRNNCNAGIPSTATARASSTRRSTDW